MRKETLLVVEDEPNLLLGIRDILELDNYQVMTAQNGLEALKVLEEVTDELPDLIVSDIMMPQMNGIELLKKVRSEDSWVAIPFIFLTARGEKGDMHEARRLGVDDYLVKPFDADDLLVAVRNKLDRREVQKREIGKNVDSIKRNILTILNHEFRTPLTLVVAYSDMLRENDVEKMNDDELLLFLREINLGADRLRRLVENFILLVELETNDVQGTYDWRKEIINDLSPLIETAYNQIIGSERVSHTCDVIIEEALPPIETDRDYFVVMLRELLDNAVKFSEPDQPILLEAKAVDGWVKVLVTDVGRGISPNKKQEIWEKFYQENRELYEDQGAGSGLAIVKGLINLHEGASVDVNSELGEGSTFTLSFPVAG